MKSFFSVLGLAGVVLMLASGCGDDDLDITPPPPVGDAGTDPPLDGGSDAGETLDAAPPDPGPIADAGADATSDAGSVDDGDAAVTDAGDADAQ